MKDEIKKNIKSSVLYGIVAFITFSLIILMVTQLTKIYLDLTNYNSDLIGYINISLITLLVVITGAYSYLTWEILDDQRKSRQIAYIERKLEKLYYPLLNYLNETSKISIIDIQPFAYLGSNKFNELFATYLEAEFNLDITIDEFQDANSDLKKVVVKDIEKLKYELDELNK